MRTGSGRLVDPLDLQAADVCIKDIARGLSRIPRYLAQTSRALSVAQHSVAVARRMPKQLQAYGLLHDAAEAYMGDVPRPIKGSLHFCIGETFHSFESVELLCMAKIWRALGLYVPSDLTDKWMQCTMALIAMHDDRELDAEMAQLFSRDGWYCWSADEAEVQFLEMWREVKP